MYSVYSRAHAVSACQLCFFWRGAAPKHNNPTTSIDPKKPTSKQEWIEQQKEFAGLERAQRNVWMQIQLDGTVRASDIGTPPWARLLADLPPMDSLRTRVTDGIGPSV